MSRRDAQASGDRAFVDWLIRACLLIVVTGQATAGRTESDIWGHMAIGLDMLQERRFFWVDPYSFTHDQPWVNHEWLWDLLIAGTYRAGGLPGVLALRALLIGVVLWAVVRATRLHSGHRRLLAIALVAVGCISQWRGTRPQLATLALYTVLLTNIRAWWLPLLFVLWANVHGGWLFGIGAVMALAAAEPSVRTLAVALVCVAATLINPYGTGLWSALASAMSRGWADVSEWQPIRRLGMSPETPLVWCMLAVAAVTTWRRGTKGPWASWWTLAAFAAAASSQRLIGLAAITSALLLAPRLISVPVVPAVVWTRGRRVAAAVSIALCGALALGFVMPTLRCFPPDPAWAAPEADAVRFLRSVEVRRVVPHFDYGEYAIFHLRDRLQVAIDNRRETVYSAAAVGANQRFADGLDPDYPDRIGADAVWWPASGARVLRGLESRGWQRRFEGPRTVILMKSAGPTVRGANRLGTPCFPNP